MGKGILITFEGVEGSGKTTQIKEVARLLAEKGHRVMLTREPGGCPIADEIRAILLDKGNLGMDPTAEILLFAAARAQHLSDVVRPALDSGAFVLCDRFSDSTYAYQVAGRGLPVSLFETANGIATNGLKPDMTFLFDVPVEVGLERANNRNGADTKEARFEAEAVSFHERVRDGFLHLAEKESGRFHVVNANREKSLITNVVFGKIIAYHCNR